MSHDILQWSVSPVLQNVYGEDEQGNETVVGKELYAAVIPVINGQPIETGWVFDTTALLVHQEIGYHLFDLFTCTCGVAGCVGIHDELHLRVGKDEVQLQIPRVEPFLKRLSPKYFPNAEAPWILTFDAQEYKKALEDLVVQVQAIEAANPGIPVSFWPEDEMPARKPTESIAVQVANLHKWRAENLARIAARQDEAGILYQAHLAISIEDTKYSLYLHDLFEAAANQVFGVQPDDDGFDEDKEKLRDEWIDEQTEYFRDHPQELVSLLKSLPWKSFEKEGYLSHPNSTALRAQLEAAWPNVPVAFVPMEKPEDQDWTLL